MLTKFVNTTCVSEIRVKQIRVNQGLGVIEIDQSNSRLDLKLVPARSKEL